MSLNLLKINDTDTLLINSTDSLGISTATVGNLYGTISVSKLYNSSITPSKLFNSSIEVSRP